MDSLANYSNLINSIADNNDSTLADLKERKEAEKEKVQEFTAPFEGIAGERVTDFLSNNILKMAKSYKIPVEKATRYVNAYKSDGVRGVAREAAGDYNQRVRQQAVQDDRPVPDEVRLGDMPKEDFQAVRSITKDAINARVQQLNPQDKAQFQQKLASRVVDADEQPDEILRFQTNQQHALDALDEVNQSNMVSQLSRTGGDAADEFGQGLKSTTTVFKNAVDESEQVASKAATAAKETLGQKIKSGVAKLGEDVGKDAVEGGEGDPEGGEAIGALIGAATFVAGLIKGRHKAHHVSGGQIMNYAMQAGS